ncbi:DsbA family protein [Celeribacter halophilus]|jgi:protein-disulfide isomerase|uniref:Protein-disulfide isomerase n=1 Tax=Celeribacter halophilus TaxID=576117 RepID=A0A1I3T091_9RHOB|nr:DsbA family protein [Celeribacter halophilus]MBU2890108.1 DsbA family protein [Celeribacter halophilus]MDO6511280.1 DsbA family protein [Celeribacter halophilus]PZX11981.1 protein-disulfide isomerase [Celeribacter halophilus]SFJ64528.1 Protein-disulfide isomerase [Celeribacter halophilus]
MNRRTFMITTALATLGGTLLLNPSAVTSFVVTPAFAQDATDVDTSDIPDLVLGDADAPIELIEYASYTCPHCANFHSAVFEPLKKDYIDTGKVRFVYREVYFDKFGLWASMVARCGGDMRYFGIQKMLYEEQSEWLAGGKDTMEIVENLRKIGKRAGLTDENLDACLNDGDMAEKLYAKFTKEVEEYDINATPSLVIDGEKHSNMSYADLKEILDAKLAE